MASVAETKPVTDVVVKGQTKLLAGLHEAEHDVAGNPIIGAHRTAALTVLMIVIAIFSDQIRPYTITAMDLGARAKPPIFLGGDLHHILGTDQLGRDVFSRLLVSIRVSLTIAVSATILGVLFGAVMGIAAAHFGGIIEQVVLTLIDVQAALPFIILAVSALAFFGNSQLLLICLLALYGWERHARIIRGLALAAKEQGYMLAVKQLGARSGRLYLRHLVPNTAATMVVSATLAFPEVILAASGLSFLGLAFNRLIPTLAIWSATVVAISIRPPGFR